ncbi:nitroreductase family protein [Nanoarchaeota archaeon]
MDTWECIKTRRSIRKYKPVPVPRALVAKVVDAGRFAPSSGNLQNWKFIVVTDEGLKKAIAEACLEQYWMEKASVHIVMVAEPDKAKRFYGKRGMLYTTQNIAAATENMLLCAHSIGLGACWVGAFDEGKIATIVHVPNEYRIQAVITVGYADEVPPEPTKYHLEMVGYFNRWRGRIEDVEEFLGFHSVKIQKGIEKGKELLGEGIKKLGDKLKEKVKSS